MRRLARVGAVLALLASSLACGCTDAPAPGPASAPPAASASAVAPAPTQPGPAPAAVAPAATPLPPAPLLPPPAPSVPPPPVDIPLAQITAGQVRAAEPVPAPAAPPEGGDDWSTCAAQGDQRCVIRALGARPRLNPREATTLIEAYRATSDTPRMCARMRDVIARFPDHLRTAQYRQVVQMRCGGR